jgi:Cu(I)/Ag(I) efflux system membrane fusion protein
MTDPKNNLETDQHQQMPNTTSPEATTVVVQRTRILKRKYAGLPLFVWFLFAVAVLTAGAILFISNRPVTKQATVQRITYTCPMHRQIHSDKPGSCPICGMTLVPEATLQPVKGDSLAAPTVFLSSTEAVRAGVSTAPVSTKEFFGEIAAVGVIQIAEHNERTITARARGRIDKLYVGSTGGYVRKGDPLYDFYSPDLLSAEQEYLIVLHASHEEGMHQEHSHSLPQLAQSARRRLELLGLSEAAIVRLEEGKQPDNTITIRAPESGYALQKLTQVGDYVDEGSVLFQLADLSTVWAEISIPETDIRFVRTGQAVTVSSDAYPGRAFIGQVVFISPVVDATTRTVRIRASFRNLDLALRPNLPITARIETRMGTGIAVPSSALVRTGSADYVWVKAANGEFRRRAVSVSVRSPEDFYKVESGLLLGDTIAVSGAFLIDAEHELTQSTVNTTH